MPNLTGGSVIYLIKMGSSDLQEAPTYQLMLCWLDFSPWGKEHHPLKSIKPVKRKGFLKHSLICLVQISLGQA